MDNEIQDKGRSSSLSDLSEQSILSLTVRYYNRTLVRQQKAIIYLHQKGLHSEKMVSHFQLGYSNHTLEFLFQEKSPKKARSNKQRLQQLGLIDNSGRESFFDSIVAPLFDSQNKICNIYGYRIQQLPSKSSQLFLKYPSNCVYNPSVCEETDEIILCNSLIDALTFWCLGFNSVTAYFGSREMLSTIADLSKKHKIKKVYCAFSTNTDSDSDTNSTTIDAVTSILNLNVPCYQIVFPEHMNANEYACQTDFSQQAFFSLMQEAKCIN